MALFWTVYLVCVATASASGEETLSLVDVQTRFPQISTDHLVNTMIPSAIQESQRLFATPRPALPGSPEPDSSASNPARLYGRATAESTQAAQQAMTLEILARDISISTNMDKTKISELLADVTVPQTKASCNVSAESAHVDLRNPFSPNEISRSECGRLTRQYGLKFREVTGYCNNIAFPNRGRESATYTRLLRPDYGDGISEPRKSSRNVLLPSARLVSSSLVGTKIRLAGNWTHMFMQFGQFLDHDLTHTPHTTLPASAKCCVNGSANLFVAQSRVNAQCLPIEIPASDPFYSPFGQKCMEFVRSLPGLRPGCTLGSRDQINQVSSYIDGNQVYGTTQTQADSLRMMKDGLLKFNAPFSSTSPRYTVLPAEKANKTCTDGTMAKPCFDAGDDRVNIQIGLQSIHAIFMRQHNKMAQALKKLNPKWDDERLYQEARAIVAAQLQHITYKEWLPVLLGTAGKRLALVPNGRYMFYTISDNPGVSNEFAGAAFRVGHTMTTGVFTRLKSTLANNGAEKLRDTFFKSSKLYQENLADEIILGMVQDAAKAVENNVVDDLSQQLFHDQQTLFRDTASFGMDLVSVNIQRGRDHGLPGYMRFRQYCGLPTANSFQAMRNSSILPDDVVAKLATVYESVEDIDLYVAGISETPVQSGLIGPTFACLIAEQFDRLRRTDRFWYENGLPLPSSFTSGQLTELRKTSLARILCDVSPLVLRIQPRVFEVANATVNNQVVPCQSIPIVDLSPWRE